MATVKHHTQFFYLSYLALRSPFLSRHQRFQSLRQVLAMQIYFTGVQALPLMCVLALATGLLILLQSGSQMKWVGGGNWLGEVLVTLVFREIGPFLTALVVIARSGTAVASELGNMKANREIEALCVMGISPDSYVIFPRLVGGILSVMGLSFYFSLAALVGGYLVSIFIVSIPLGFFVKSILSSLSAIDLVMFLVKSFLSGFVIFSVACFKGLSVQRSPTEVPVVTTQAVVTSIVWIVCLHLNLSLAYYFWIMKLSGVQFL